MRIVFFCRPNLSFSSLPTQICQERPCKKVFSNAPSYLEAKIEDAVQRRLSNSSIRNTSSFSIPTIRQILNLEFRTPHEIGQSTSKVLLGLTAGRPARQSVGELD